LVLSQFKAGKQPKVILEERRNTVRDFIVLTEAKNPQFRIDTEQPGAFDYLFKLRDCSIGQFADCFSSPEIFDENGGGPGVRLRKRHQKKG